MHMLPNGARIERLSTTVAALENLLQSIIPSTDRVTIYIKEVVGFGGVVLRTGVIDAFELDPASMT